MIDAPASAERRTTLFLNVGHTLDHLFMLIFPTVVLAMSAEMQAKMKGTIAQMEPHRNQLGEQLIALEQELQSPAPGPKAVSTLASSVLSHLDAMSKIHHGRRGKHMKMKM